MSDEQNRNKEQSGMTLVQQVGLDAARQKKKAAEEYFTLLARNKTPQKDDAKRLAEVMALLGRKACDLEEDLEIISAIDESERATSRRAELEKPMREALHHLGDVERACQKELDQIRKKHQEAIEVAGRAHGVLRSEYASLRHAAEQRRFRLNKWNQIIGGEEPNKIKSCVGTPTHIISGGKRPTREEIIEECRRDLAVGDTLNYKARMTIDAALNYYGYGGKLLTDEEVEQYGIDQWISAVDGIDGFRPRMDAIMATHKRTK